MTKRIKKPPITPEQRRDWLKRYDQGEKPPRIAGSDDVDVRTVRLHLNKALEEREIKEARTMVLRNALELHYADLCSFAEKLDSDIKQLRTISLSPTEKRMEASLRQHLSRSPIWRYLTRWDTLHQKISKIKPEVDGKLEKEVKSDTRLDPIVSDGEIAVIPGIIGALVFQVDQWSQGYSGLKLNCDFIYEPTDERSGNLRYGFSQMDKVKQEHVAIIREFLEDFESRLKNWEGFMDLEKFFEELKSLRQKLGDELAIIKLKRIVSGRCKYCPL